MNRIRIGWLAVVAAVVVACGKEGPTAVGGSLLPGGAVRSFEVVLDPDAYLVGDTAFSDFVVPSDVRYRVIAHAFGGVLEAHALARFEVPTVIAVVDSAGVLKTDSTPTVVGARIVLHVDTAITTTPSGGLLRAYRIAEAWDPRSASWTLRVDTAGVQEAWSEAGGTRGALIDTATVAADADSVVLHVDTMTLHAWRDTSTLARGALIEMETPGGRVRTTDFVLRVDSKSEIAPDTVVTTTSTPPRPTFVYTPSVPAAAPGTRIGGIPAWRTFLHFRDDLDSLAIPCPDGPLGCTMRLGDASITYGALMLVPEAPPAGFLPEDSIRIGARELLVAEGIPLVRSPLGDAVGLARQAVLPATFTDPGSAQPVEVPITDFLRLATGDSTATSGPPPGYLALLPVVQGGTLGFAAFGDRPRLRLVLTVVTELQLR